MPFTVQPMRVLLVEDNEGDAELVRDALHETAPDIKLVHVERLAQATELLRTERFDAVVLDLSLPDASGLEALVRVREVAPSAPIVVLTSLVDPSSNSRALEEGAQDFLQKGHIEGSALVRALRAARERQLYVQRGRLLGDVGSALSSSLEPPVLVRALIEAVCKDYATSCTLEGAELDGSLDESAPLRAGQGRAKLYAALGTENTDADRLRNSELQAQGMQSAIVVRFPTNGRTEGTLTFARDGTRAPYGFVDVAVAEEVTARLTASLEHSALLAISRAERNRAEVAGQLRDDFLATLSHELRTPLSAILGWTQMLLAGDVPPEKQTRALQTIERNTLAQVALIEDVLDVSRIITGKMRLDIRPVSLVQVVSTAIETVRPAADSKGVQLSVEIDVAVEAIQADPDRLQQVLWNLLANAVKFTPSGGRVSVHLVRHKTGVELRVSDTGQGIAPEFLPHVFERFRQADSSKKRAHSGLGLGLAIARQLTELHGGTIKATSDGLGQGTTFTIFLPVSPVRSVILDVVPPKSGAIAKTSDGVASNLAGLLVLIVDDDCDTRDLLRTLLENALAVVTSAGSAAEGISALRANPPNVLISDIGMPGATGYDLIGQVRALSALEGGRTPAIALTAYARDEDRSEALSCGFDKHLSKPVRAHELLSAVSALARQPRTAG